jgi:branched-chain amino acid transport system permease protein
MSQKPPPDQQQEPSESKPPPGDEQQSLRDRYRRGRDDFKARRVAGTARVKSALKKDLEPVTRRFGRAREWSNDHSKLTYPLIGVVLITLAAILPYLSDWIPGLPLWVERATSGSVLARLALFALFALGLNVVVGFAGLLDLGYVAFWAIGSYTAAILTGAHAYTQDVIAGTAEGPEPSWQPWMWGILIAALGVAVIAGILLGSPTLRLRGDYLAIVTLGFGEIVRISANNLDGFTGGPRGVRNIPHPEIHAGGLDIEWGTLLDVKYYWLLLVLVVLWVIAIHMLNNSRIGRAWVAIREDEVAAAAMGIPIVRMKLAAFAIGACTAGVGGVVYAEQVSFINPTTFTIIQSILILSMVVIGGMGSITGAIVGAAIVILLPEIFRALEAYRFFVFGLALVVLMIFRPQGIFPSKRRKAELLGGTTEEQLFEAQSEG